MGDKSLLISSYSAHKPRIESAGPNGNDNDFSLIVIKRSGNLGLKCRWWDRLWACMYLYTKDIWAGTSSAQVWVLIFLEEKEWKRAFGFSCVTRYVCWYLIFVCSSSSELKASQSLQQFSTVFYSFSIYSTSHFPNYEFQLRFIIVLRYKTITHLCRKKATVTGPTVFSRAPHKVDLLFKQIIFVVIFHLPRIYSISLSSFNFS